jgi:hypothetical protein
VGPLGQSAFPGARMKLVIRATVAINILIDILEVGDKMVKSVVPVLHLLLLDKTFLRLKSSSQYPPFYMTLSDMLTCTAHHPVYN